MSSSALIRVEHEEGDQLLYRKRFACAGERPDKMADWFQEVRLVAKDQVMGDGILAKVNAALVLDFLVP